MTWRTDYLGGYFDCCGMSRARGHHELCHHYAKVIEAQRAETAKHGSVADESAAPKGFAHD
jgi:hypothetical protein